MAVATTNPSFTDKVTDKLREKKQDQSGNGRKIYRQITKGKKTRSIRKWTKDLFKLPNLLDVAYCDPRSQLISGRMRCEANQC